MRVTIILLGLLSIFGYINLTNDFYSGDLYMMHLILDMTNTLLTLLLCFHVYLIIVKKHAYKTMLREREDIINALNKLSSKDKKWYKSAVRAEAIRWNIHLLEEQSQLHSFIMKSYVHKDVANLKMIR